MIQVEVAVQIDKPVTINQTAIKNFCNELFHQNKQAEGKVSFIITNDEKVSDLKYQFFQERVFTDVIAFNLEEKDEPIEGEIYISLDRVCENASIFEVSTDSELRRVIIHGLLHLLGFEDESEEEKTTMTKLENQYLNILSEPVLS